MFWQLACWVFIHAFVVVSWFFFKKNQLFQKFLTGTLSECQTVWIQIRTNLLSGLIWVQTVCKGYQQTIKVAARKERVMKNVNPHPPYPKKMDRKMNHIYITTYLLLVLQASEAELPLIRKYFVLSFDTETFSISSIDMLSLSCSTYNIYNTVLGKL